MRNALFFKKRFHGGREIRTHDQRPMVLPTTPFVKALVRWATGKRLTNRLPKLSLITLVKALVRWVTGKRLTHRLPKLGFITLSPPLNSGILGLRMGLYVPTPKFFYNLWGPKESDLSDS